MITRRRVQEKKQNVYHPRAVKWDFTLKAIFPVYDLLLRTRIASCWDFKFTSGIEEISKIEHTVSACCFKEHVCRREDDSSFKGMKWLILVLSRIAYMKLFFLKMTRDTLILIATSFNNFYMNVIELYRLIERVLKIIFSFSETDFKSFIT